MPKQLCFLHIPKTAGLSMTTILEDHFALNEICPATYWTDLIHIPQEQLADYGLFRGHFHYDAMQKLLPHNPQFITMLRHPIKRAISAYGQLKRNATGEERIGDGIRPALREKITTLDVNAFLQGGYMDHRLRNRQTQMLSSEIPVTSTSDLQQAMRSFQQEASSDLELAKQQLASIAFFGLVEHFQESLFLLAYTFGWWPSLEFQVVNAAPKKDDQLTAETHQYLENLNDHDLALYEYAETIFSDRYQDMCDALGANENATTTEICTLLEQHYWQKHPNMAQPIKRYSFDQTLEGAGWYHRETNEEHGVFRWTGPSQQTTLLLPLDRKQPLRITFSVLMALDPTILDSVQLWVDGQLIPLQKSESQPVVFSGIIPAAENHQTDTQLVLIVERTQQPNDADERFLGIAVNWLEFESEA